MPSPGSRMRSQLVFIPNSSDEPSIFTKRGSPRNARRIASESAWKIGGGSRLTATPFLSFSGALTYASTRSRAITALSRTGLIARTAASHLAAFSGDACGKRTPFTSGLYVVTSRASWSVTVRASRSTTPYSGAALPDVLTETATRIESFA